MTVLRVVLGPVGHEPTALDAPERGAPGVRGAVGHKPMSRTSAVYHGSSRTHEPCREAIVPESQPISWRSIVYGTPVIASDGIRIGTVHEVLGSDAEDIFHGLRVALTGQRQDVMVSADDIAILSLAEVRTVLTRSQIDRLPAYDETATYHLASVGWLRKHLGWRKDAKSDEEPG